MRNNYVARILRGDQPSELPIQAPVRRDLLINLETAKGDWRRCATDAARPGGGGDNQLTLRDSYVEPCHRARPRLGGAAQELAAKLAALLLETDGDGHLLLAIAGGYRSG